MKRLFMSVVLGVSLLSIPTRDTVARAAGPPQPSCIPSGNACLLIYRGSYTDPRGITISASWDVDINSGNIVSVSPSYSNMSSIPCGPSYYPSNPNYTPYADPVTVSYQPQNSQTIIELKLYNSGSYSGFDGTTGIYCLP